MLIPHKKKFIQGLTLALSFGAMFWIMMLPLFHDSEGSRLTSLQYADAIFNELSKGSSWFIPEVNKEIESRDAKTVDLSIRIASPELMTLALAILKQAGIREAHESAGRISFRGNLYAVLQAATKDSASLYNNDGEAVSSRYDGTPALQIGKAWWSLLNPCIQELQKQDEPAAAAMVEQVVRKAIEPAYNFYGLPSARVSENILLICGMLAFYVLYAIWYGFAIYYLFDGFGLLGTSKAKKDMEDSEV